MPHKDPVARRAYLRAYYKKHGRKPQKWTPKRRKYTKEAKLRWEARNPDKVRAQRKSYRKRNLLYFAEAESRRRALIKQTQVEIINYEKVIRRSRGFCGICNEPLFAPVEIDHIVPLSKNGTHTYDNLQAAHMSCNRKKWAKVA